MIFKSCIRRIRSAVATPLKTYISLMINFFFPNLISSPTRLKIFIDLNSVDIRNFFFAYPLIKLRLCLNIIIVRDKGQPPVGLHLLLEHLLQRQPLRRELHAPHSQRSVQAGRDRVRLLSAAVRRAAPKLVGERRQELGRAHDRHLRVQGPEQPAELLLVSVRDCRVLVLGAPALLAVSGRLPDQGA